MKKKFRFICICCICLLLSGCGSQKEEQTDSETVSISNTDTGSETTEQDTKPINRMKVTLNGKEYEYNDHLSNFLFLGVDKSELTETSVGRADAGQTDALFLVSWDRVTNDITVVSIPRDTMTTINVFSRDGVDLGPVEQHISLAYGYGDGKHKSCELTKEAVSRLFYRLPIQGYCAITLEGMEQVSGILGSVTVTVPNDSLEKKEPSMSKGSQVEITKDNVELFIRYRDITVANTALYRLERQQVYLEACSDKLIKEFSKNPGIVTDVYTGLESYMVTNIGNDQFVKLVESMMSGGNITQWTIPGEGVETDVFDEFHVDKEAFYEQIVLNFFKEVD